MNGETFVAALEAEMAELFSRLGERGALESEGGGNLNVAHLLELALTSELEAAELAARWLPTTSELDAKLLFGRQCGDEMKHYALIRQRLEELGQPIPDTTTPSFSALYHYLVELPSTIERVAGGPFTREAIAQVRNQQFIALAESQGDAVTAQLYREVIQPDEATHQRLAHQVLARLATTPEAQELAARACRTALAIADELSILAERSHGIHPLPVS
jgi:hypothetical protein